MSCALGCTLGFVVAILPHIIEHFHKVGLTESSKIIERQQEQIKELALHTMKAQQPKQQPAPPLETLLKPLQDKIDQLHAELQTQHSLKTRVDTEKRSSQSTHQEIPDQELELIGHHLQSIELNADKKDLPDIAPSDKLTSPQITKKSLLSKAIAQSYKNQPSATVDKLMRGTK